MSILFEHIFWQYILTITRALNFNSHIYVYSKLYFYNQVELFYQFYQTCNESSIFDLEEIIVLSKILQYLVSCVTSN